MAVCGGSATVATQFHIVHLYDSHLTKGEPRNLFMKAVPVTQRFLKIAASAPPSPFYYFEQCFRSPMMNT